MIKDNHETIGSWASGLGSILQMLPAGKASDKLKRWGEGIDEFGKNMTNYDGFGNFARNTLAQIMRGGGRQQGQIQQARPQNQQFGTQPTQAPIQQPPITQQRPSITAPQPALNTGGRTAFAAPKRRLI